MLQPVIVYILSSTSGCMAERLKDKLLEKEKSVDIIAGPDSYRQLPFLLSEASSHQVQLKRRSFNFLLN